jgi:hypothetical protein
LREDFRKPTPWKNFKFIILILAFTRPGAGRPWGNPQVKKIRPMGEPIKQRS